MGGGEGVYMGRMCMCMCQCVYNWGSVWCVLSGGFVEDTNTTKNETILLAS